VLRSFIIFCYFSEEQEKREVFPLTETIRCCHHAQAGEMLPRKAKGRGGGGGGNCKKKNPPKKNVENGYLKREKKKGPGH